MICPYCHAETMKASVAKKLLDDHVKKHHRLEVAKLKQHHNKWIRRK